MRRILAILPFALGLLAGCAEQATTPTADEAAAALPADQVFWGFKGTILTPEGVRSATIVSDSAYSFENAGRFDLYGVHLEFFNETGVKTGTLTSERGDYDFAGKMFTARGNVVLITPGPNGERRLETDEMFYDIGGDRLWSDHPFTLNDAGRISRGQRFTSNSKGTVWEVTGGSGDLPAGAAGGLSF